MFDRQILNVMSPAGLALGRRVDEQMSAMRQDHDPDPDPEPGLRVDWQRFNGGWPVQGNRTTLREPG